MTYKWCIVPQCKNTTIKTPNKLFLSVPTNPERRKMWLKLAKRDPDSIVTQSNVFMCEDHFDMLKDTKNYMKFKMGFSQKLLLEEEAVPSKFHCQENRKRRLSDTELPEEVFIKIEKIEEEYLQSESATESLQYGDDTSQRVIKLEEDHKRRLSDTEFPEEVFIKIEKIEIEEECLQSENDTESLQYSDDMTQRVIKLEDLPETQEKGTNTDPIITVDKSTQTIPKFNVHFKSKAVQTKSKNKNISSSTKVKSKFRKIR